MYPNDVGKMRRAGFVVGDRILGQASDTHPNWCAGYGRVGEYVLIGASAIGNMHLREKRPRDDAFAIRSAGAWVAVAVADGVGSRPYSRYGSSYAVEALCEQLLREALGVSKQPDLGKDALKEQVEIEIHTPPKMKTSHKPKPLILVQLLLRIASWMIQPSHSTQSNADVLVNDRVELPDPERSVLVNPTEGNEHGTICWQCEWDTIGDVSVPQNPSRSTNLSEDAILRAFQRTRLGLEQFVQSRGLNLSDVSCTLQGLLLNTETGVVAVGHIGDGLIATLHQGLGAHPLVTPPRPGATGETFVFTQKDWQEHLSVRYLNSQESVGITTFYLMTDGVADDCIHPPPEDIFQRWARDIDRELRKHEQLSQTAARLLYWLANYKARGSWDDRTLVVILRKPDTEQG